MTGYIITAALTRAHTDAPIETQTWRKYLQMKDSDNYSFRQKTWSCVALTYLALSLGCYLIILLGGTPEGMRTSSSTETFIKSMLIK